ncbi:MAG: 23S rRNA (adenine(2503)-C(2))-methyltransferase RlmN [Candidatus Wallbacteria bacterium]|nr:23S rRNA (adenine(2503)-C(2))-methyltransferase RlmN [Candidatus Wallbacteria bacterium]
MSRISAIDSRPPVLGPSPSGTPEGCELLGLPPAAFIERVRDAGGGELHARKLLRRLYRANEAERRAGVETLAAGIPGLPNRLLARLRDWRAETPRVARRQVSAADPGTVKLLLESADGATFETVLFRNRRAAGRWSLCVSTQAGCRMACPFCATGRAGLKRNLTAAEIAGQLLVAREEVPAGERIANVVAMGMGEPLDNLPATLDAIEVLNSSDCLGVAADRIVISTCGHVPGLERLARHPVPVGLAVSLHASTDALRDRLVPLNRRYPLARLLATLKRHPLKTGKWICFEYILLKGVNDSDRDAAALGPLLEGLRALVQIIPYNPIEGAGFEPPTAAGAREFAARVRDSGVPVALRRSRGPDIDAACGQLRAADSAPD